MEDLLQCTTGPRVLTCLRARALCGHLAKPVFSLAPPIFFGLLARTPTPRALMGACRTASAIDFC